VSRVVGIDPGQKGGLAYLVDGDLVEYERMPVLKEKNKRSLDKVELVAWFKNLDIDVCVIERVHSMPKQGVASTFKFGFMAGQLDGIVTALNIRLEYVTPQFWKKAVLRGTDKSKLAALTYVQNRYGISLKKNEEGSAEAICIALSYG